MTGPVVADRWNATVEAFLAGKRAISGSHETYDLYAGAIRRFRARCPDLGAATQIDIEAFIFRTTVRGTPPKPSTIQNYLKALSGLYRRALRAGLVTSDPTVDIDIPRIPTPQPRGLNLEEQRRLLAVIPTAPRAREIGRRKVLRDYAMVRLALESGLRLEELLGITVGALHDSWRAGSGHWHATVKRKGGKVEQVHIPPAVTTAIAKWLTADGRDLATMQPEARLWKMSSDGFAKAVKSYGNAAGIPNLAPHELRHSFCKSLLIDCAVPLPLVAVAMSHNGTSTTDRYARVWKPERGPAWEKVSALLDGDQDEEEERAPVVRPEGDLLLTSAETGRRLGISGHTVKRWALSGHLPAVVDEGVFHFWASTVEAHANDPWLKPEQAARQKESPYVR